MRGGAGDDVCVRVCVVGFGRVMDCLLFATHFPIKPQHPGGGERETKDHKEGKNNEEKHERKRGRKRRL